MENKTIARKLRLLSQLMELHDVNQFKARSIANAAFKVDKLPYPAASKSFEQLEKVEGVGKSIAAKITELLESGTMAELQELLGKTPDGVLEMMAIKGVGPKRFPLSGANWVLRPLASFYMPVMKTVWWRLKASALKRRKIFERPSSLNWQPTANFYTHRLRGRPTNCCAG